MSLNIRYTAKSLRPQQYGSFVKRDSSTSVPLLPSPTYRRAMLYVPGSNTRMLKKSFDSPADCIAYDLEDAVSMTKKSEARQLVSDLLEGGQRPKGEVMVRINACGSDLEELDLEAVLGGKHLEAIALPKTSEPDHLKYLISRIEKYAPKAKHAKGPQPIKIIAMIESARAIINLKDIIESGRGYIDGLLFAAEDYCADVGLTRTAARTEMLYPRSAVVTAAKAYGLQAIDLVCVNYKDGQILREESEEGKILGFDGKQAIHPSQVEIIHRAFSPNEQEIERAARIRRTFEDHGKKGQGAYSLDGTMIDAPMYKQALKILSKAEFASSLIPASGGQSSDTDMR